MDYQDLGSCHDNCLLCDEVKYLRLSVGFQANLIRSIFLPVMVVTLPLPARITQYFPREVSSLLQWFAFWTFAILLTIPWLFCVYRLVTSPLGRTKRIHYTLNEQTAPKTVVVMPVYKEQPDVLLTAINSVVSCDYPPACIHVFLSFDGDAVDELYLSIIDRLGIPIMIADFPKSIDVAYNGARITVSRFPHGGKRHCQKATFKLIDKIYTEYLKHNDDLFILFIDSDCILDQVCIQNFMYEMELKPGSQRNMLAMTGVITSTTEKTSLITLLQDMEYVHGQLFERSVESGCGAVTCLPGALTILRFSAFRKVAKYYFADQAEQCEDLFDYGKCHLGEDRWLTHLFMIGAKKRYQIQICTSAFCKTEAVQTFRSLLKQRRRWFLGFITNEVCMLTDIRIWRRYPLLCVTRLMQNSIRTTALLFFIMVISIITTSNKIRNLPVGFIAVSLGLNYLLMAYFGWKLRRFKAWLYPIMFVLNPFFNWVYMVYGIFTAGQRTWGGPRADAGVADARTSPEEAIKHAEATGNELNVVPETFRSSIATRLRGRLAPVPLQPSNSIEGRFAAAEKLPDGMYQHSDGSRLSLSHVFGQSRGSVIPHFRRDSDDSVSSFRSATFFEQYMPRRLDTLHYEQAIMSPMEPPTSAQGRADIEKDEKAVYQPDEQHEFGSTSDSHGRLVSSEKQCEDETRPNTQTPMAMLFPNARAVVAPRGNFTDPPNFSVPFGQYPPRHHDDRTNSLPGRDIPDSATSWYRERRAVSEDESRAVIPPSLLPSEERNTAALTLSKKLRKKPHFGK